MTPRLLIEPTFSIEYRIISQRELALPSQPDFLLVHFLESQISTLKSGTSLLSNPNQAARLALNHGRIELLIVRIAPELLIETATRLQLYRSGSHLLFRSPLAPLTSDVKLCGTLESIANEMEGGAAGWREMIGSHVNQLAVYLLRAHINVQRSDEIELSRAGIVDRRLRRAIEFMHDNCGHELALAEIAAAAYLSEFHFARLFKKITGATPHSYLAGLRIERARRLLAKSDLPITEVGAGVGYASQSHFTKVFREATGMTPHAFRRAARSTGID
ncbi:MAG: helix-turn-helix transcriptional regulator [Acidobacteriota bacterium]|nr:helix-turn-helix transcriptional regulator [Acidobacteriota bacterium]